MVAYSFKARFAAPILAGTKRQTIRDDRKRHARPGEEVQLYTGMRTKHCKLIGRATVLAVHPVTLYLSGIQEGYSKGWSETNRDPRFASWDVHKAECNAFAKLDGFGSWRDLKAFWAEEHAGVDRFDGVLIRWGPLLGIDGAEVAA